jgi:replicative DNA helicase
MRYASEEAEAVVLSAIINNHPEYIDKLSDDDLTITSYKTILQACRALQEEGKDIDLVTVGMKLKGMSEILMQISSQYFKGVNYESYIEALKGYTTKRKVHDGVHFINSQLENVSDPASIKANILDYFSNIPLHGQKQDDSIKTVLKKTKAQLEYKHEHRNDTSNHTGIHALDEYTGGLHPSEVTIIAARPSVGKTALGVQIALQVASKGKTVQIFSREMSQAQLGERLLAHSGKIDGQRMRTGNIRTEDWTNIKETGNAMSKLPLFVNDEATNIPAIRAVCSEKKYKSLDLVVIDYMQLIEPTERGNNREREVAEISRALKKMSLEFDIPIIVLSQLNRSASNKRPTLDTLRESGAIEQDADNVIMLHKPDESDIDPNDLSLYRTLKTDGRVWMEVIIGKQRNGPTGIFNLSYIPKYFEFVSVSRRNDECPF